MGRHGAWQTRAFGAAVVVLAAGAAWGGEQTYLVLGDSLAFGYTSFAETVRSNGDGGYARLFADRLGEVTGARPRVLNLAVPGETIGSYEAGGQVGVIFNENYPFLTAIPTQRALFLENVAAEAAAGRTISHVTVQFGANDLFEVTNRPGFFSQSLSAQRAELAAGVASAAAAMRALVAEVVSLTPGAFVQVVGYYNPYPGAPQSPRAPLSDFATLTYNEALASIAGDLGVGYVDVFDAFRGRELELTLIGSLDLGVPNIHANAAGYAVIADLLRVPAPGAVVALVGAGVGLVGRPRRRVATAAA